MNRYWNWNWRRAVLSADAGLLVQTVAEKNKCDVHILWLCQSTNFLNAHRTKHFLCSGERRQHHIHQLRRNSTQLSLAVSELQRASWVQRHRSGQRRRLWNTEDLVRESFWSCDASWVLLVRGRSVRRLRPLLADDNYHRRNRLPLIWSPVYRHCIRQYSQLWILIDHRVFINLRISLFVCIRWTALS